MTRLLRTCGVLGSFTPVLVLALLLSTAQAQSSRKKAARADADTPAKTVDLFGGVQENLLAVQVTPRDHTVVRLVLANQADVPLQVELPPAFGAVPVTPPVLYQQLFGKQPNNPASPNSSTANNNTPQPLGVWSPNGNNNGQRPNGPKNGINGPNIGNNAGPLLNVLAQVDHTAPLWNVMDDAAAHAAPLMNVAGAPGGGAALKIPAGQSVTIVLHGVCLAYGSPTPTPRMAYRITPLEKLSPKPEVRRLLTIIGSEDIPQRVAQPAAWYLANGLPWDKMTDRSSLAGVRAQKQRFSPDEILAAQKLVQRATATTSSSGSAPVSNPAAARSAG